MTCVVTDANDCIDIVLRVPRHGSRLCILPPPPADVAFLARNYSERDTLLLYHFRFGHRNFRDVAAWLTSRGIPFEVPVEVPFCAACVQAKSTRFPLRAVRVHADAPRAGYMFHTDNCCPMSVPTRLGQPYFNILVDDYSRYLIVTLMKTQSGYYDVFGDVYTHLQAHLAN